jgi:dihydroneopterin aldolase
VSFLADVALAAEKDDVAHTIDYGAVYRALVSSLSNSTFPTLKGFAEEASRICPRATDFPNVETTVCLPKALLHAENTDGGVTMRLETNYFADGVYGSSREEFSVKARLFCVIGVNPHEREAKQPIGLSLYSDDFGTVTDFQQLFSPLFDVSYSRLVKPRGISFEYSDRGVLAHRGVLLSNTGSLGRLHLPAYDFQNGMF